MTAHSALCAPGCDTIKPMKASTKFEPGLLQLFRLYVSARFALYALGVCSRTLITANPSPHRYPIFGFTESLFLLLYLAWPWLRGRVYLPLALTVASAGPIIESAGTVALRLRAGLSRDEASPEVLLLLLVLFVPLVLTAWQYRFRGVLLFCAGTTIFELVLFVPLAVRGGPYVPRILGVLFVRDSVYLVVGYLVARLNAAQRAYRAELTAANAQLARYAATTERLTVSQERNRMARELHDTLAHTLSAVSLQLEAIDALWDADPQDARATLARTRSITHQGLQEVRRALHALRAQPLEDLGLALGVQRLAEKSAERAGIALEAAIARDLKPLRPEIEQSVYRVAEEALTNVVRHANAGRLRVTLCLERGALLCLEVQDDGVGFDLAAQAGNGRYGMVGMHERAALCGGTLHVESQPGQGTIVRLSVEV